MAMPMDPMPIRPAFIFLCLGQLKSGSVAAVKLQYTCRRGQEIFALEENTSGAGGLNQDRMHRPMDVM